MSVVMSETGAHRRGRVCSLLCRMVRRLHVLAIDIELAGLESWEHAVKIDGVLEEPELQGIRKRRQRLLVLRTVLARSIAS